MTPKYRAYLKSEKWQAKRKAVLSRAGHKCEQCSRAGSLDIHHATYERVYDESLTDLLALCRPCHLEADNHRRRRKAIRTYARKRWGPSWGSSITWGRAARAFDAWLSRKAQKAQRRKAYAAGSRARHSWAS